MIKYFINNMLDNQNQHLKHILDSNDHIKILKIMLMPPLVFSIIE